MNKIDTSRLQKNMLIYWDDYIIVTDKEICHGYRHLHNRFSWNGPIESIHVSDIFVAIRCNIYVYAFCKKIMAAYSWTLVGPHVSIQWNDWLVFLPVDKDYGIYGAFYIDGHRLERTGGLTINNKFSGHSMMTLIEPYVPKRLFKGFEDIIVILFD